MSCFKNERLIWYIQNVNQKDYDCNMCTCTLIENYKASPPHTFDKHSQICLSIQIFVIKKIAILCQPWKNFKRQLCRVLLLC